MQPTTNASAGMPSRSRTRARPVGAEVDLLGAHRVGDGHDLGRRGRRRRSGCRAVPCEIAITSAAWSAGAQVGPARDALAHRERAPAPTRPHERRPQPRRQHARHQLLLLVVEEQHVVRAPRRPSALRSRRCSEASATPATSGSTRDSFGPIAIGRTATARPAADAGLVGEHHALVAARGERVEHLDRGELGTSAGRRRHHADDLQTDSPISLDRTSSVKSRSTGAHHADTRSIRRRSAPNPCSASHAQCRVIDSHSPAAASPIASRPATTSSARP